MSHKTCNHRSRLRRNRVKARKQQAAKKKAASPSNAVGLLSELARPIASQALFEVIRESVSGLGV
jgi:hypothetical protein